MTGIFPSSRKAPDASASASKPSFDPNLCRVQWTLFRFMIFSLSAYFLLIFNTPYWPDFPDVPAHLGPVGIRSP
jgi:hypothetical protein